MSPAGSLRWILIAVATVFSTLFSLLDSLCSMFTGKHLPLTESRGALSKYFEILSVRSVAEVMTTFSLPLRTLAAFFARAKRMSVFRLRSWASSKMIMSYA